MAVIRNECVNLRPGVIKQIDWIRERIGAGKELVSREAVIQTAVTLFEEHLNRRNQALQEKILEGALRRRVHASTLKSARKKKTR